MKTVMDLPEDFTYSEAIVSKIDGLKLGAQEWYGTLEAWDSEAQLAAVKKYYEDGIAIGIEECKSTCS